MRNKVPQTKMSEINQECLKINVMHIYTYPGDLPNLHHYHQWGHLVGLVGVWVLVHIKPHQSEQTALLHNTASWGNTTDVEDRYTANKPVKISGSSSSDAHGSMHGRWGRVVEKAESYVISQNSQQLLNSAVTSYRWSLCCLGRGNGVVTRTITNWWWIER